MAINLTFDEYDAKYKRIINTIEIDEPVDDNGYYEYSTSLDNPLSFEDDPTLGNTLFINDKYLKNNLDSALELVIDTITSTIKDTFQISVDELINRDVIKAIIENRYIKKVSILSSKGLSKKDVYFLLMGELKKINCTINYENEDELLYEPFEGINILNYPSIGKVNIADFYHNRVNLVIDYELSKEELVRLKKLFEMFPQEIIRIEFETEEQMDEILSMVKSNVISLKNNDNWGIEEYGRFDSKYSNVMIEIKDRVNDDIFVKPSTLIEKENILDSIISEVVSLNLSPLEQYMYLYNVVKQFKEYKDISNDIINDSLSREVVYLLFNDYMVCVGYVLLLDELVKKLDNPNIKVSPYSCYIEDDNEVIGHMKALVKITDDKYNVDGIYIADPTWDSVEYLKPIKQETLEYDAVSYVPVAHHDYYNHFLMTKDEMVDEDIEYASFDVSDVLFKHVSFSCKIGQKEAVFNKADTIMKKLLNKEVMSRMQIDEEICNIKQEPISLSVLVRAIKTLYSNIYVATDEELNRLVNDTINLNSLFQKENFTNTKYKFDGHISLPKIKDLNQSKIEKE